jgi:hypothetical protein
MSTQRAQSKGTESAEKRLEGRRREGEAKAGDGKSRASGGMISKV